MATENVIESSQTNKSFWRDFGILSSVRKGCQKLLEFGRRIRKKCKRKQLAKKAKTLPPEEGPSLWRLGTRLGGIGSVYYLGDKSMTGKVRITRTYTNQSSSLVEEKDEPLIPELLNDIVLDEIMPKLPWKAFHVLSLVNRGWQRAVHSHPLYGDELFQDDEQVYHPGYCLSSPYGSREAYSSLFLKVKERSGWRLLNPLSREYLQQLFSSQAVVHYFSNKYKYWSQYWLRRYIITILHSFLFTAVGRQEQAEFFLYASRMIKDDLFVVVGVWFHNSISDIGKGQICVLRSKGFGSGREKIVWEKIDPSVSSYNMLGYLENS